MNRLASLKRMGILTDRQASSYRFLLWGMANLGKQTIRLRDFGARVNYLDWVDRMIAAKLQIGPVLDIICDGLSLRAVDRKWQHRKGWARKHLLAALDLYKEEKCLI